MPFLILLTRRAALILSTVALFVGGCAKTPGSPSSSRDGESNQPTPAAARTGSTRFEFTHPALDARFRVVAYLVDPRSAAAVETAVIKTLATLEETFNAARPTSEIAQIEANAGIGSVHVSDALYGLFRQLQKIEAQTGGAVGVTAGVPAKVWADAFRAGRLPDEADVEAAQALAGRGQMLLDPIRRSVQLNDTGARFNLGATASAYACDRVVEAVQRIGVKSMLVTDGAGHAAAGEPPPERKAWVLRVLDAPADAPARLVRLNSQAAATSGRLADFVTVEGERFAARLDPLTGVGSQTGVEYLVVARRAWQADAYARAAAVKGISGGQDLLRSVPGLRGTLLMPPIRTAGRQTASGLTPSPKEN